MEGYLAQVIFFAGNFAPRTWAFCNGQLLAISSNTALFSLLGTIYGGDGRTTFALPDLRGRSIVHPGQGPGLSNINLGERAGNETHTLIINEMPSHNHVIAQQVVNGTIGLNGESGGAFGNNVSRNATNTDGADQNLTAQVTIPQHSTANTGGSQAFGIRNPYLGINAVICLQGIFPSRN